MKKLLLFAIILGGSIAFTSCSKDEECIDNVTGDKIEVTSTPGISESTYCTAAGGTMK